MAKGSIYGPPEGQRRRAAAPTTTVRPLKKIELLWLGVLLVVCVGVLVHLDEGDPELADTLRQLQRIESQMERIRFDPILLEMPKFEPLQTAEIIRNQPVPADPATRLRPLQSAELLATDPPPSPALQSAGIISTARSPPRSGRRSPARPAPPGRLQTAGIIH